MLIPMARTMLLRAQNKCLAPMSVAFWEDALMYAAWVLNRVPDAAHLKETACTGEVSTPYERMHQKRPDVSKARVWGAKAWAYLDKEQRESKLHEVAVEGRFVGMDPNGAGWLIYANGRYYQCRFAKFDEQPLLQSVPAASDDSHALDGEEGDAQAPSCGWAQPDTACFFP